MNTREFIYDVTGQITVTAASQEEAEERMMRVRSRLEEVMNNVEVEFSDHQPVEQ